MEIPGELYIYTLIRPFTISWSLISPPHEPYCQEKPLIKEGLLLILLSRLITQLKSYYLFKSQVDLLATINYTGLTFSLLWLSSCGVAGPGYSYQSAGSLFHKNKFSKGELWGFFFFFSWSIYAEICLAPEEENMIWRGNERSTYGKLSCINVPFYL